MPYVSSEQHGDYVCSQADGGTQCYFEYVPEGFAKTINGRWDLEGELNDARPKDSPPMTWYFQNCIQFSPRNLKRIPLHQTFITGPGVLNALSDQLSTLATFPSPTKTKSFYWYTGTMPEEGQLVRNKLHTHGFGFEHSFFFDAEPTDLGLHKFPMGNLTHPDQDGQGHCVAFQVQSELNGKHGDGCVPITLEQAGFKSFDELRTRVFENLTVSESVNGPKGRTPSMICESWGKEETVDGFEYDRRFPACCKPWKFRKGQKYTILAFLKEKLTPMGP